MTASGQHSPRRRAGVRLSTNGSNELIPIARAAAKHRTPVMQVRLTLPYISLAQLGSTQKMKSPDYENTWRGSSDLRAFDPPRHSSERNTHFQKHSRRVGRDQRIWRNEGNSAWTSPRRPTATNIRAEQSRGGYGQLVWRSPNSAGVDVM